MDAINQYQYQYQWRKLQQRNGKRQLGEECHAVSKQEDLRGILASRDLKVCELYIGCFVA